MNLDKQCGNHHYTDSCYELPKHIETTEHPDGRKDVTITVHTLDVDLNDPSNVEAKEYIEKNVLPKLAAQKVMVTLIHKPTNDSFTFISPLANVRKNAEISVKEHAMNKNINGGEPILADYCLVQNDGESVKVTSL